MSAKEQRRLMILNELESGRLSCWSYWGVRRGGYERRIGEKEPRRWRTETGGDGHTMRLRMRWRNAWWR